MFRFILFLIFCCPCALLAQEPLKNQLQPCGAPNGVDPWLIEYSKNPGMVADRSEDTLKVAMQIHLLANDNGSGRFSPDRLLTAFCRLNTDYAPAGIRFFFKNPWNLINNSSWFQHTQLTTGIEMMLTNDVPDVQNTYFVNNPAGNCGYNLPYAGVAMSHSCSNADDHTWAHEIGHALSMPHTFIGWEGKIYNYNTPTPLTVTYDYTYFHDTLDTQVPAPLDTALVEFVDGSNCTIAADRFCDTPPDYLSYRWNCDANNQSLVKQKDPNGTDFYSDGTLYMSYASDECQNRFSPEEIAAMRANLLSEKIAWLYNGAAEKDVTETVDILSPVNDEIVPYSGVDLHWTAVPNATFYLVSVSRIASFPFRDFEIITTDTTVQTTELLPNKKYFWRVRPFNNWSACAPNTNNQSFMTSQVSSLPEIAENGWKSYPNPGNLHQPIWFEFPESWKNQSVQYSIVDVTGRVLGTKHLNIYNLKNAVDLPTGVQHPGVYQIIFQSEIGAKAIRIVISGQ